MLSLDPWDWCETLLGKIWLICRSNRIYHISWRMALAICRNCLWSVQHQSRILFYQSRLTFTFGGMKSPSIQLFVLLTTPLPPSSINHPWFIQSRNKFITRTLIIHREPRKASYHYFCLRVQRHRLSSCGNYATHQNTMWIWYFKRHHKYL